MLLPFVAAMTLDALAQHAPVAAGLIHEQIEAPRPGQAIPGTAPHAAYEPQTIHIRRIDAPLPLQDVLNANDKLLGESASDWTHLNGLGTALDDHTFPTVRDLDTVELYGDLVCCDAAIGDLGSKLPRGAWVERIPPACPSSEHLAQIVA